MSYVSTCLKKVISIDRIVTIHYFEYLKNFNFQGEKHNFWEFLCVDRGSIEVQADDKFYILKKNDLIFHKPMEFHALKSYGNTAPNLVVISFDTESPAMKLLNNKVLTITENEKVIISKIIKEARLAFSTPLHIPSVEQVQRSLNAPFGAEQMIKLYLEQLLIGFIRNTNTVKPRTRKGTPYTWKKSQDNVLNIVLQYLELHICERLTVEKICNDNIIGRSYLQQLFHRELNCGVIDYFNKMKIQRAKQIIRDGNKNFSEISEYLSYSASSYFSKKFKQLTGMSPSEYALSIKGLSDTVSTVIPCEKEVERI